MDFFLHLDYETTGLDPVDCTQLEVGWTVLDDHLSQLTPLRRRYTALSASGDVAVPQQKIPQGYTSWTGTVHVEPVQIVKDMHTRSGLIRDWLATPAVAVVRRQSDLDRLLVDDLVAAGWTGSKDDKVYLSGAGVSHFDHLVLKAQRSQLILDGVLHYSAVDSSVAARTLGIDVPKDAEEMEKFLDEVVGLRKAQKHLAWLTALETERGPLRDLSPNLSIDTQVCKPHRAPDDVAWSLLFARLLRLLADSDKVGSKANTGA